jgi:glycosyltransferase involved in cell wall biosynthesis
VAQALDGALNRAGVAGALVTRSLGLTPDERAEAEEWHRTAGARLEREPPEMNQRGWRRIAGLARWYAGRPERLVNLHSPTMNGVGLPDVLGVRLARKQCLLTIQHPGDWSGSGGRARSEMALVAALADLVAVSTPALRANLSEVLPGWLLRRRAAIVPPGVEPPRQSRDRRSARSALGLPEDRVVAVTISRLVEGKGLTATVRALGGRGGVIHLVAGDGPLRPSLEREAGPGTRILGPVPDIDELLAAADLFVLASEMEGFGLAFVEAAMWGVPSVGCAVGGVPWVIEDGVTGLLVQPGDDAALEEAIDRLIHDPGERRAMGERARRRATLEFSADAMAVRYLAAAARLDAPRSRS